MDDDFRGAVPACGAWPAGARISGARPLWLTLLGAALMFAVMVTICFTPAFHMTLLFGIPFLIVLPLCMRCGIGARRRRGNRIRNSAVPAQCLNAEMESCMNVQYSVRRN
ncbi:hypothetical protein WS68_25430 [Burkholderia sp. TSV86]|nr:hypothetical protein WS68_25430 [Burkholderia sp. TSV86]